MKTQLHYTHLWPNVIKIGLPLTNTRYIHVKSPGDSETPNPLPAYFIRGGTSKGIFLNAKDLPKDRSKWTDVCYSFDALPTQFEWQSDSLDVAIWACYWLDLLWDHGLS